MNKQMAQTLKILAGREKTFPAFFVVGCLGYPLITSKMSLAGSLDSPYHF
jgi:hypothetical protein